MDAELRDAFKEVRDQVNHATGKLEGRLDAMSAGLSQHIADSAANMAKVNGTATALHFRLDEHLAEHRSMRGYWAQIIVGVAVTVLGAALLSARWFGK
ncbi:MAG TPA: hypothetical protein DEH78_14330 [Solibacterales bacterium]|nr:hypothetical protein [Bryobacterales bacterium]